jgi:5-methyltetrahydropteroyltriglutamate--homocysteine methyltransferase
MYTSHVGSFPLPHSDENVVRVFHDLIAIGVDYPPYPQLRDFISIFLNPLSEIGLISEFNGVFSLSKPISDDYSFPLLKPRILEAELVAEIIRVEKSSFKAVRGCVTGPFTLASQIQLTPEKKDIFSSTLSKKNFVLQYMVNLVRRYVEYLHNEIGFKFIVVDEPILSVIVGSNRILFGYTAEDIINAFNTILSGVDFAGVHVCGLIPPMLKNILLNTGCIKILDHEFKDTPRNIEVYRFDELERYDKFISFGCVSSKNPNVESEDDIAKLINVGVERFGDRLIMVKPDCGFRGLIGYFKNPEDAYKVSIEKLKQIVNVAKKFGKSSL